MKCYVIKKRLNEIKDGLITLNAPDYTIPQTTYLILAVFKYKKQALAFIKNEKLEGFKVITINI